jgi:threonine synthase
MARLLEYFIHQESDRDINVLVATSGDTGSAVANGFLGVKGVMSMFCIQKGKSVKSRKASLRPSDKT